MLCKDGSVLCALDYRGLDVDNIGEFRVKAAHDAMQNAASSPDKRVYQANLTHGRRTILVQGLYSFATINNINTSVTAHT
jgi:hypothetical protein